MSTDTSPKPVVDPSGNLKPLMKKIADAYKKINEAKLERGSANANIADQLTSLEAEGISKKAMRMAMTYVEMDEDQRLGFDIAYAVAREALGQPIQGDMFRGPAQSE